ncbi:MAG TPA: UDP-N-acetylglucosamine 2-epimerase (non-hydrolyzing) [Symbiobacteriaceae bacterium]|nr:UDP-N-acetylglucosamine 2-epimerase (non-hydrolyzing) [Symbiobacteriaceae bacterium]
MAQRRKIMTIFGTRPEGTKMVPVIQALHRKSEWFDVIIVNTGQHREQLDQVFQIHNLKPQYDLAVMQPNQTLSGTMVRMLTGLDEVIAKEKPDMVLVHGDTSTTAAGALAAFYQQVAVGHVEAGLRTYNKYSPWPEEINRRMAGVIADVHFAPTPLAKRNLLQEHVNPDAVFVAGQTGVDATMEFLGQPYTFETPALRETDFQGRRVIAVTAHRRENYGEPMRNMFTALRALVDKYPDTLLVYPVHLAPAVREVAFPILDGHPRIVLLDPIPHPDMLKLMSQSHLVMADSGGLQEETPCMGVPQVLMRETTERPEAVEAGVVIKAGTSYEGVFAAGDQLLSDPVLYDRMARARNPFGDGRSSDRIAEYLGWKYGFLPERPAEFTPV